MTIISYRFSVFSNRDQGIIPLARTLAPIRGDKVADVVSTLKHGHWSFVTYGLDTAKQVLAILRGAKADYWAFRKTEVLDEHGDPTDACSSVSLDCLPETAPPIEG